MSEVDLFSLTTEEEMILADLVHDAASEAASAALNAGEGIHFLLTFGYAEEDIREMIKERKSDAEGGEVLATLTLTPSTDLVNSTGEEDESTS
jgi:hypothetical protein